MFTSLQCLASYLADTAQSAQELCAAEVAQMRADDCAKAAHVAAQLAQCPIARRTREVEGRNPLT